MTGILMGIGSIVVLAVLFVVAKTLWSGKNAKDIESKISYEVNKLIKKVTAKNLDQIKQEIYTLMGDYRMTKAKELASALKTTIENLGNFDNSLKNIDVSIFNINNNINEIKKSGKTDPDTIRLGAQYLQIIDQFKKSKEQLLIKQQEFETKKTLIENQIDLFDTKFSLKKAQIDSLLASVTSIENSSANIDIHLDNLVNEFKLKAIEDEAVQRMSGVKSNDDVVDTYDVSYEDKFRELLNN